MKDYTWKFIIIYDINNNAKILTALNWDIKLFNTYADADLIWNKSLLIKDTTWTILAHIG